MSKEINIWLIISLRHSDLILFRKTFVLIVTQWSAIASNSQINDCRTPEDPSNSSRNTGAESREIIRILQPTTSFLHTNVRFSDLLVILLLRSLSTWPLSLSWLVCFSEAQLTCFRARSKNYLNSYGFTSKWPKGRDSSYARSVLDSGFFGDLS